MISGKVEKGFFFRYTYYRRRERKCMQADTNVRVTETYKKKLQEIQKHLPDHVTLIAVNTGFVELYVTLVT